MNRNRLLGLFLFIALIVPQPSQAQIGGYYHMVGVYIHKLQKERSNIQIQI